MTSRSTWHKKHKCKECDNLTFETYCRNCYLFKHNPAKNPLIAKKMGHKKENYESWKQGCKKEKHWNWMGGKPKCIDCEITLSRYNAKRCRKCSNKYQPRGLNKNWSKEQKRKLSLTKGGTGIPYENSSYPTEFFRIRNKILERDNYICQLCLEYGNEVHHKDYNKENNNKDNLICLCRKCNMKVNKNRDYWANYFKEYVRTL